jgi:DNA-binding NarL/FixJ family response regulator
MRILIVDDSVLIIERLQLLLAESAQIAAVYGAVSYRDGLQFLHKIKPDVVLIDSRLQHQGCFTLLQEVQQQYPNTQVIILHNGEDVQFQQKCVSLGADVFLDKYNEFELIPLSVKYKAAI